MQEIKINRRLPFGFAGDWGVLYKLYTFDDIETVGGSSFVKYQDHNYLRIKGKVQLKTVTEGARKRYNAQVSGNLVYSADEQIVETTDAYFDVEKKTYFCIIGAGDILEYDGQWWEVAHIDIKVEYTPGKQEYYYCTIKKIEEGIITW